MREHGLTFARYEVLAWLAMDPESSLTLSWISKTLRIPPATVTNIIDYLEDEGLVRRVTHPTDAPHDAGRHHRPRARGGRTPRPATSTPVSTSGSVCPSDDRATLTDLLRELRASGNEFDVGRSDEVIEEVGSRHGRAGKGPGSAGAA